MTATADRLRGAPTDHPRVVGVDSLADRIGALARFLRATAPYLDEARTAAAYDVIDRAGQRLALSLEHTVVALAGPTGSGKSSLFNALAGMRLSPVGIRRPTTTEAYACIWGGVESAISLLDWLGLAPARRFVRESVLDGDDQIDLRGLVLLDLPDFDSVEEAHRVEVDRLLGLVDMVVWVVDPQKYADKLVHDSYLREFHRHRDVAVVALNQADTLRGADLSLLMADLQRLLDADELTGVPAMATSALDLPAGLTQLRACLESAVAARQSALRRMAADLDDAVLDLADLVGPQAEEDTMDRAVVHILAESLAWSAGVSAVVSAVESSYRRQAYETMGWPLARWTRLLRTDPMRSHAGGGPQEPETAAPGSTPSPGAAQRSAVGLAARIVASSASAGLPPPWPEALATAARSRLPDLPGELDAAVAAVDLRSRRTPAWWWLIGGVQWLLDVATLAGLTWLTLGWLLTVLGLPLEQPRVGTVQVPVLLVVGSVLLGVLLAVTTRPVVGWAARRARSRAEDRLRTAVTEVGRRYVVAPARVVLHAYGAARDALFAAAGLR